MEKPSSTAAPGSGRRVAIGLTLVVLLVGAVALSLARHKVVRKDEPLPADCPPNMVLVPGGTFTMGSRQGTPFEKEHPVQVRSFCMDRTEVTAFAYAECASCSKENLRGTNCNYGQKERQSHPMNCLTWDEARAYCAVVGKRLATEQEWEYAARGGAEGRTYPWGATPPDMSLACWKRTWEDGTCEVGRFAPGAYGLYDMVGGVSEWVEDWRGDYPAVGDQSYRGPPSGKGRMHRGGSWRNDNPTLLSSFSRDSRPDWNRISSLGFRCVKDN
jgi:formylglycine-generating enzyme required for sulfatase activity